MPAALQYQEITKEYRSWSGRKRLLALDDFSLTVETGEILGFLGPNGAGKTTAMHLALGFMRPTKGNGRALGQPFGDARTRRRVGFLAENVAFYHRSARDLLRFYGALNGLRDPELASRVKEVIDLLQLNDVANRNAGRLSRGMLQRLGLAQALVNAPDLLLLDEPTSALDPGGRVAVRDLLLQQKRGGKTVFLSSHLLSEIELICDRVAILHKGRLIRLGRTSELLESSEEFEVVARGISASAVTGAAMNDGNVVFTVRRDQQRAALEKIWSAGGEVLRVNPRKGSLEDVFLVLTGAQPAESGKGSSNEDTS
ncbi:MAG TPA: ABC transporter ATP-binding protein [Terriglobales bacterium]|nr:ABC transporter ATP-binding protein [Terriglobales bacterium]